MGKLSKKNLAYEFIYNQIKTGKYGPGYRLVISDISKALGISTIPVREAINKLAHNGIVDLKHNSGAVISTIDQGEYKQIMKALSVMEGYATSVAAEKLTEDKIKKLEELNSLMEVSISNWNFDLFRQLNHDFHMLIIKECGNKFLIDSIARAWKQLDLVRQQFSVPKRAPESIKEHHTLISMIRNKVPGHEIEAFSRKHKNNTLKAFFDQENK